MNRSAAVAMLIISAMAGTTYARGFGGGIAAAASYGGPGDFFGDSAYGAGLPWFEPLPGADVAYGGVFSGPPQDNLASKSPGTYNPLGGEQAGLSAPRDYRAERMQSFNSSLAGMGIQTGGFRPGQFGPPPGTRNSSAGMPSDLGMHQASSERSDGYRGSARRPSAANATRDWSTADLRVQGNSARSKFRDYNIFGRDWFAQHPGAWSTRGYTRSVWTPASWEDITAWSGGAWALYEYTYGTELTYENEDVCIDGRPIATAAKCYDSANAIAGAGERAQNQRNSGAASWLPLGVYEAIPNGATSGNMFRQLAVNKAGIIRGNYFDAPAKNLQLIQGSIDKDTGRAAWVVADKKNIIFDCVLFNLTKSETPIIVHMGKDKTEQWVLVRLNQQTAAIANQ